MNMDNIDFSQFEGKSLEEIKDIIINLDCHPDNKVKIIEILVSLGVINKCPLNVFEIASMYAQHEIDMEVRNNLLDIANHVSHEKFGLTVNVSDFTTRDFTGVKKL